MIITVDFNSNEALYMQLRNQIVHGIATSAIREGDTLPPVRQLAEDIGVNMHTVNKAYTVLKQEGLLRLDRRRGTVVVIHVNQMEALAEMKSQLAMVIAKGRCKNITKEEVYRLVDEIFEEYR